MKFEYLQEFLVLAEMGNYSLSADKLFISQSSLTRHIQDMERELGITLFNRSMYGLSLTPGGDLFLPYAKKAVQLQHDYTSAIALYLEKLNGNLSVGSVFAMPEYGITSLLAGWHKGHSDINMRIMEGDSEDVLNWLRTGMTDFAFIREDFPASNADFDRITINDDHLVCLVPEHHPLAGRTTVSIGDLKDHRIIYYENCAMLQSLFLGAGYDPSAGLSGAHGRNAVTQVKEGLGIMLEFRKQIGDWELGGFHILDVIPEVRRNINLLFRPDPSSQSSAAFVRYVRDYASGKNT